MYYTEWQALETKFYVACTEEGLSFVTNDWDELNEYADHLIRDDLKLAPFINHFEAYAKEQVFKLDQITMDLQGTDFQKKVWQELINIPYGETRYYAQIAEAIGKPTATRAVASAIGKNPLLIVIPCHRVIGKNGKLTGFRSGLPLKERLLQHEKIQI